MNNIDMKNDSFQEKQDTNKDENAKVDNVQEKHADDKDEIGEDEFWNTQFTDSQCEELENQAKEEDNLKENSQNERPIQKLNSVEQKPTILGLKCGTKEKQQDCGGFLDDAMENYKRVRMQGYWRDLDFLQRNKEIDVI
ncbi:hypothetical protein Tco_0122558 [Tanacetum coccineum]